MIRRRFAKFSFSPHKGLSHDATGKHAHLRLLQPAFIMAGSGKAVSYSELDARCNRLASRIL
jgi:long-chain acyl-CoA synthetase